MPQDKTRRDFLAQLGASAAGVLAAGYSGTARGYGANETLNIGAIGTGGRCRQLMNAANRVAGVRIVAVCDIWDRHLEEGLKLAQPGAKSYRDFHELLADKDLDAVIIGSPDHWHVPMTVAACEAGKDVYVEKPATHDLSEGVAFIEAQTATNERKSARSNAVCRLIKAELLTPRWARSSKFTELEPHQRVDRGKETSSPRASIEEIPRQRPRPTVRFIPFSQLALVLGFRRRHFHRFDGALHRRRLLVPGARSSRHGGQYRQSLSRERLVGNARHRANLARVPPPARASLFRGDIRQRAQSGDDRVHGSEGTLYLDSAYEIHPDAGRNLEASEFKPGTGERGADFDPSVDGELLHVSNWIECVRSRKQPNCPAEAGVAAAAAAHLSNQALRSGQVARWEA